MLSPIWKQFRIEGHPVCFHARVMVFQYLIRRYGKPAVVRHEGLLMRAIASHEALER